MSRTGAMLKDIPIAKTRSRIPFFAHVIDLLTAGRNPWDVFARWIKTHGSIVRFSFFNNHFVILAEPEYIKQVFQTKFKSYDKDIATSYSNFLPLLGTGLVTSHGEHWAHQRRLISSAFKVEILEDTARVALAAVDRLSAKLDGLIAENGRGSTEVEMAEEFRKLTLQVIGEAVLSMKPEESDKVFPALYLPIVDHANDNVWYPWKAYIPSPQTIAFHKSLSKLNTFFSNMIKSRLHEKQGRPNKDILDRILDGASENIVDKASEDKVTLQLRDEIKTFIFAGHETSSMMLSWALYELFCNPECMQKVLDEANRVFTPDLKGKLPPYEKLQELSYTQNVLREALRKYYIVPVVTRVATEDDVIGGYTIPKGTKVVIPILSVHTREDLYPEPDKFKPERFDTYDPSSFSFLGFINGQRQCLGQHFALLETKIVLALLVQRFIFGGKPNGAIHPYKIPVCPLEGLVMDIRRRSSATSRK
jgi:cytochrome P450